MIDIREHSGTFGGGNGGTSAKVKFSEITVSRTQPHPKTVGHLWIESDKNPNNIFFDSGKPLQVSAGDLTINAAAHQVKPTMKVNAGNVTLDYNSEEPDPNSLKIAELDHFDVYAKVGLVKYWSTLDKPDLLNSYFWNGFKWQVFSLTDIRYFFNIASNDNPKTYYVVTVASDDTVVKSNGYTAARYRSVAGALTLNPILGQYVYRYSAEGGNSSIAPGYASTSIENPRTSGDDVHLNPSSSWGNSLTTTNRFGYLYAATAMVAGSFSTTAWNLQVIDLNSRSLVSGSLISLSSTNRNSNNTMKKLLTPSSQPDRLYAVEYFNNLLLHKVDITKKGEPVLLSTATLDRVGAGFTLDNVDATHMDKDGTTISVVNSAGQVISYDSVSEEKVSSFKFNPPSSTFRYKSFAFDEVGNLYVCYTATSGTERIYLAKYDKNGAELWSKKYDGVDYYAAMTLAPGGIIHVWQDGYNGETLKVDSDGDLISRFSTITDSYHHMLYGGLTYSIPVLHEAGEMSSFPENW